MFIHEEPELYFVPYARNLGGMPKAARGKLWSTYTYMRKTLKKVGILPPSSSNTKPNEATKSDGEYLKEQYCVNSTIYSSFR